MKVIVERIESEVREVKRVVDKMPFSNEESLIIEKSPGVEGKGKNESIMFEELEMERINGWHWQNMVMKNREAMQNKFMKNPGHKRSHS